MKTNKIVLDLAADFKRWGKVATKRVRRGVKKYGLDTEDPRR